MCPPRKEVLRLVVGPGGLRSGASFVILPTSAQLPFAEVPLIPGFGIEYVGIEG
jgi:hypothetical protein